MNRQPTIRLPGEGRAVLLAGDINRFVVTGRETNGAFAQWEVVVPPGGGPEPHVHSREEEGIFVLEGEVVLTAGGASAVAGVGTFVGLPAGQPHAFKNESAYPARLLFTVAPAGLEEFFFEVGTEVGIEVGAASAVPNDLERLRAAALRYGVTILTPQDPKENV